MLSWSAKETNQDLDIGAVIKLGNDPLIAGSRQLADLGLASVRTSTDSRWADAIAVELGAEAAMDAAAVAGAFEYYNRIVDATGLPIGKPTRAQREGRASIIADLDLGAFPHAHL